MTFSLEFLSTELLFEVFEYLFPFDLFRSFSHLKGRFDGIVRSYPLRLNCRSLSRSNFDFICRHIQPSQVIALSLSDETMPDQVHLFLEHFPNFHREFSSLRSMALIESETTRIHLPISVSSISIRNHQISDNRWTRCSLLRGYSVFCSDPFDDRRRDLLRRRWYCDSIVRSMRHGLASSKLWILYHSSPSIHRWQTSRIVDQSWTSLSLSHSSHPSLRRK